MGNCQSSSFNCRLTTVHMYTCTAMFAFPVFKYNIPYKIRFKYVRYESAIHFTPIRCFFVITTSRDSTTFCVIYVYIYVFDFLNKKNKFNLNIVKKKKKKKKKIKPKNGKKKKKKKKKK